VSGHEATTDTIAVSFHPVRELVIVKRSPVGELFHLNVLQQFAMEITKCKIPVAPTLQIITA
jgi:hypothetical protein